MPERIREVFALDKSGDKGKCRHKRLCSYDYSDADLDRAERVLISENSTYVEDHETVARTIEDPTHVEFELGLAYTPGAFSDASKWGLSVQRLEQTSPEDVENFGRAKAEAKSRKYRGYVTSNVGVLRAGRSAKNQRRLVAVFSTPLDGIPSHADVYACNAGNDEKEATKALFWRAFSLDQIIAQFQAEMAEDAV